MQKINVEVIGAETAQTAFKSCHHIGLDSARAGLGLGRQHNAVTHAPQTLAHSGLGRAEAIAFGSVEICDATMESVADQLGIRREAGAEADVRNLEPSRTQSNRARSGCSRPQRGGTEGQRPNTEKLSPVEHRRLHEFAMSLCASACLFNAPGTG